MPALEGTVPVVGAPCWVSLMARDLRAAQSFYSDVMGWVFRPSTLGSGFSVALEHGEPVAGIGCCQGGGHPAVWTPYFAVKDADETAARISERGATLAVGPLPLREGRAGIAADRDGAVFGFWEGPALTWSVGRGSAPVRLDLQTRDVFDAAIFYAEVFDWARPPGGCTVDYAQDHIIVQAQGRTVATLHGGGDETGPDPRVRPRWNVHFRVRDGEQTAAAAVAAGGESSPVPTPADAPDSAFIIRDPDGALFTLSGA
ncbi:VOC family protein [Streptomyces sanglieri]|uniref:VOC family protein n=1 Tax=Streptomyces sanglieri TaxID=193460 RepID=A0ABW2X873_9ACTN|nr:VOC family protein [Streptomyces sp. Wh19]MDV9198153.1 VOC family protein [Streptomyces sp. Wh19]